MSADETATIPNNARMPTAESLISSHAVADRLRAVEILAGTEDAQAAPLLAALQRDNDASVAEAARLAVQDLSPTVRSAVRRAWFTAREVSGIHPTNVSVAGDADHTTAPSEPRTGPTVPNVTSVRTASSAVSSSTGSTPTPAHRAIWTVMARILDAPEPILGRFLVPRVRGALARTPFDVNADQVKDVVVAAAARGDVEVEAETSESPFSAWRIARSTDYQTELGVRLQPTTPHPSSGATVQSASSQLDRTQRGPAGSPTARHERDEAIVSMVGGGVVLNEDLEPADRGTGSADSPALDARLSTFAQLAPPVASLAETEEPVDAAPPVDMASRQLRRMEIDVEQPAVDAAAEALDAQDGIEASAPHDATFPLPEFGVPTGGSRDASDEPALAAAPKIPRAEEPPSFRIAPTLARGPAGRNESTLETAATAVVRARGPVLGRHLIAVLRAESGLDSERLPRAQVRDTVEALARRGVLHVSGDSWRKDFSQWELHVAGSPAVRVRPRGSRTLQQIPASEIALMLEQRGVPRDASGLRMRASAAAAIVAWYSCTVTDDDVLDELLATEWSSALR